MSKKKEKIVEEFLKKALVPEEEQPYEVPENWVWIKLSSSLEKIEYGYTESATKEKIGPHFLRITDIQDDKVIWDNVPFCSISDKDFNKYSLKDGDIVVARTGATTGKSFLLEKPPKSVFASYLIRLRTSKIISSQYLWTYMKSPAYWKQIMVVKKGSTQPGANAKILGGLKIPLPPINEQKRISDKVERLLDKINIAKQLIEEAKETFELRRATILDKAFRGELTTKWREDQSSDFEDKLINLINNKTNKRNNISHNLISDKISYQLPKGWKWVTFEEIFNISGGGTPSKTVSSYWNGGVPWVTPKDMKTLYIENTIDTISQEGLQNSSAILASKGSIVIVVRSGILKRVLPVAQLMQDSTVNQDMKIFNSGLVEVNRYLMWYILGYQQYLLKAYCKSGTTVNSIDFQKFKKHRFPLPPFNEIKEILTRVEDLINKENSSFKLMPDVENIEKLKQSIISKAFRGELGTNDPNEETALVLLKEQKNN